MRIDSSGVVQVRNTTPTIQLYNTDNGLASNQTLGDIDWYQIDPSDQGVGTVAKIRAVNISSFSGVADLAFYTGNASTLSERMRIAYSGNVGIGTTSPGEKLQTYGSNANIKLVQSAWKNGSGNQGGPKITFHNGGNSSEQGSALATLQSIDAYASGGAFDGELGIYVSAGGVSTQAARFSKHGLSFGTDDPGSSNALDDYEEGTWTPTFYYDFPPPSINYINQQGYYTKIGNIVTVWFDLYATGMNSGSYYYARLSGLPYAMNSNNQYIKAPLHHSRYSNFSVALGGGTNPVFFYDLGRTTFATGVQVDSAYISGHFSYQIA
jgi:hypothetical protein